jgi:glycosyltransferase involved in cell wall biosynthesis
VRFINTVENTVHLADIGRYVPFIGDEPQSLEVDFVRKSNVFQSLILSHKFKIVAIEDDRVERNLQRRLGPPPIETMKTNLPLVTFRGAFYGNAGYAKSNRNLVNGLISNRVKVTIDPVDNETGNMNEMELAYLWGLKRQPDPKGILINSCVPSFADTTTHAVNILCTTVESVTIPAQFSDNCNRYDEVWVTSDFCRDVLNRHGVKRPFTIVPNAVDTRLYNDTVRPHPILPPPKGFRFVSVFQWNWRKGYDALLKAYYKAFTAADDVSLLIVTPSDDSNGRRSYIVDEQIVAYRNEYGGSSPAHVVRCGQSIPEFEMPRLYRACQCFVLPSRGEGFGLPYAEASLCGLPVIATKHGGQLSFLNEENSYLVEIDEVSPKNSEKTNVHFWAGQSFPQLTSDSVIDDLARQMKLVRSEYDKARERNEVLKTAIASKFNCEAVGRMARERLEEIWKNHC